jgi:hypothetical protein
MAVRVFVAVFVVVMVVDGRIAQRGAEALRK